MTREERFEIYEKMLVFAEYDLIRSIEYAVGVFGFCSLLREASNRLPVKIDDFEELMQYKPEKDFSCIHWFDTDPNGPDATKRIDILKKIL